MTRKERTVINKLPTGVPGLDYVVGGGLPEFSFNVIAGTPGAGKTTLAHQIMFANATPERPALYFTILGEPPLKMLRYQQQFDFFDFEKVGTAIHFVNLAEEVLEQSLDVVLDRIVREVARVDPAVVVVDSFRSIVRSNPASGPGQGNELQAFVQRLSLHLATWQATTFLVGEYDDDEIRSNPVFTVADGMIMLSLTTQENTVVRQLQVKKMRGQREVPGFHGYRLSSEGMVVFPRIPEQFKRDWSPRSGSTRLSSGIRELDKMMGGGIPLGDVLLVAGPVGSGKSILLDQFILAGAEKGEPGVLVLFDENPIQVLNRTGKFGHRTKALLESGMLKMVQIRPLDLSPAEMFYEIDRVVSQTGARRVSLDSMAGLEVSLAPIFREQIRENLARLVESFVSRDITVMVAAEIVETNAQFNVSGQNPVSFTIDDVIVQRYVQIDGELQKIMGVLKMRCSDHEKTFRLYDVTPKGLEIQGVLKGYHGQFAGVPELRK